MDLGRGRCGRGPWLHTLPARPPPKRHRAFGSLALLVRGRGSMTPAWTPSWGERFGGGEPPRGPSARQSDVQTQARTSRQAAASPRAGQSERERPPGTACPGKGGPASEPRVGTTPPCMGAPAPALFLRVAGDSSPMAGSHAEHARITWRARAPQQVGPVRTAFDSVGLGRVWRGSEDHHLR